MYVNLFFCEGVHDVAFFQRLLKDNDFVDFSDGLATLIPDKDIGSIIVSSLKNFAYDERQNLKQKPFIPAILLKDDNYVLIYPTGGHIYKHKENPEEDIFLKAVTNFHSLKNSEIFRDKITDVRISLFYDADENIHDKLNKMNDYLKGVNFFTDIPNISNGDILNIDSFNSLGCYILKDIEKEQGCLEDILIEILDSTHQNSLNGSIKYIDEHIGSITGRNRDFDKQKAMIGIVGQLEKSGVGNGPIIAQTSFFKNRLTTKNCTSIYQFIENTLNT